MCRTSSSPFSNERNSFGVTCFDLSLPSYPRLALSAVRRKLVIEIPGTTTGYWNARNMPSRARSSGSSSRTFLPLNLTVPPSTVKPGWPIRVWERVDLPEPLGPMTACTSPLLMVSVKPLRISLPSTLARRSRISKSANSLLALLDFICAVGGRLAHPRGPGHRRPQQPLVHLLFVHAVQAGAGGNVLDGAVAVADREPAPSQLDHLGHVAVLSGKLRQLADAAFKV